MDKHVKFQRNLSDLFTTYLSIIPHKNKLKIRRPNLKEETLKTSISAHTHTNIYI